MPLTLLDAARLSQDVLPRGVDSFLMRWRWAGREFVVMMLDERLREIEQSARRRYVVAHELAHLICGHQGSEWVLRRVRGEQWAVQLGFGEWLDGKQERESDVVAAYLLVPMRALREMEGMESGYMARMLDVPERVVELRWEIWSKRSR
jgi:Zn-dependent peptidase ImmA (M78 family)